MAPKRGSRSREQEELEKAMWAKGDGSLLWCRHWTGPKRHKLYWNGRECMTSDILLTNADHSYVQNC